jgi:hypothetical protein
MEVQPDIQQRSGLDQASGLGPARLAFRTPDVCGLQLIQRSEPGWSALPRALTHPPPSARHRHHPVCPPQADYVRRRVMRDCGVALPYARLVDPCLCSRNIQGVLDLLSGFDITAPVRATGRPTPRLPSNENRSASLGHRPASMFWHLCCQHSLAASMSTPGGSSPVSRTERQKSSLGDAGLECCGAFFTTADILSLTAFVVSHFRAIHDRGMSGLNHEQSDLCRQTAA